MRTYIPLNENGKQAKAFLSPVLSLWAQYREIRALMAQMPDPYTSLPQGYSGAAVFMHSLQAAEARLVDKMRENERQIVATEALSPLQLMVLTLRYVQGCDWPTIAEQTGLERARLYQEHRIGLNMMGDTFKIN